MALRARAVLLVLLSVVISQIGLHCHGYSKFHSAHVAVAAHDGLARDAHGSGEHRHACRQSVPPVVLPPVERTTDVLRRLAPLPPGVGGILAVLSGVCGELASRAVNTRFHGASRQPVGPSGIGLLVLIGVLRP
jgi:hypothetical protein